MGKRTPVLTPPRHRQDALAAPRGDVFSPPAPDRWLPVHHARAAPLGEHASWAFVAVHGGSGAGLLTRLVRDPYDVAVAAAVAAGQPALRLPGFAVNAGRAWPDPVAERVTEVVVVCRTTMRGLVRARDAAAQYLAGNAPTGVHLVGVVTIADQPGRLPHPIAAARGLLAGVFSHIWHVPYVPEYRLLTGLPGEPCPPCHPAVDDVLGAIRATITTSKGTLR